MSSHNFHGRLLVRRLSIATGSNDPTLLPLAVREREQRGPVHAGLHPARDHRRRHRGGRASPTRPTAASPARPSARCSTARRSRRAGPSPASTPALAVSNQHAYVHTFAQIGNTLYMGGKFLQVQHGIGGPTFTQSYLAAFDVNTGEWIPTFNPVIDAPVWKIMASPDGTKLFVGGEFTNVNGVANTTALAALDPATGAPVPGHQLVGLRVPPDRLLRRPGHVHPGPVALPRRQLHQDHRRHRLQLRRPAHAQPPGPRPPHRRPPRLELGADARDRTHGHQRQRAGRPRLRGRHLLGAERRDPQPEPPGDHRHRDRCGGPGPEAVDADVRPAPPSRATRSSRSATTSTRAARSTTCTPTRAATTRSSAA